MPLKCGPQQYLFVAYFCLPSESRNSIAVTCVFVVLVLSKTVYGFQTEQVWLQALGGGSKREKQNGVR